MRGINKKMILLPILLMSMLTTMIAAKPIPVETPITALYLSPVVSTGAIGDEFAVDVMVKDVIDLYGYEFKVVAEDPNLVLITSIDVGDFLPTPPGNKVWKMIPNINDPGDGSFAWLAVTRPLGSASGVTGSGKLATVHYTITGMGATYLFLVDTILGDPFDNEIAHTTAGSIASSVVPTIALIDIRKRRSTNRPGDYSLKFPSAGTTETLMGEVENLGTIPMYARVKFLVYNEAGLPVHGGGTFYSDTVLLEPGQSVVLTADMPIDSSMVGIRYYATNYAEYAYLGITGAKTASYTFIVTKG